MKELTPEQEDYILEEALEQQREQRTKEEDMKELTPEQEDYILEEALEQQREQRTKKECSICGTEIDEDMTVCLRCDKEIVDAQEEQYHKTMQAEMELSEK